MAETVGDLMVKIGADVGDVKSKLAEIGVSLDRLASSSRNVEGGFTKLEASTVTLEAALSLAERALDPLIEGLRKVADFVEESVTAAGKEETAQARLAGTLRAAGQFSEQYAEKLHSAADALSSLTGFSNEAITESQDLFVAFGATAEQIPQLTQAAITLAKTFGGDLTERARQLITDINGDSEALGRLGIKHLETAGKAQRLADVLAFTNRVADPSKITGYEQSISKLANAFENASKAIGQVVISTPEFQALIATLTSTLDGLVRTVAANRDALIEFAGKGVDLTIDAIGVLIASAAVATRVFESLAVAVRVSLAESGPKALAELRAAGGGSLTPISDGIDQIVTKAAEFQARFRAATTDLKDGAKAAAGADGLGAIPVAVDKATASAASVGASFDDAAGQVSGAADAVVTGIGELATAGEATAGAITTAAAAIAQAVTVAQTNIRALGAEFDRTPAQAKKAADAIKAIKEETAKVNVEAATAGLSDLNAELVKTEANVRKLGTDAGLTANEISGLLAPALDAARAKAEAVGTKAFKDMLLDIAKSTIGVQLFGREFSKTGPIIDKVRQSIIDLKAEGLGATDAAQKLSAELKTLERSQKIEITANTTQAESAVNNLIADIQRGSSPIVIAVDKEKADKKITELEEKIKHLKENDPIRLDAETTLAKLKIQETQALAEEPAVKKLTVDDSEARRKLEELKKFAEAPFSLNPDVSPLLQLQQSGAAAQPAEILAAAKGFSQAVADALRSGDAAQLAALKAQGENFNATFAGSLRFISNIGGQTSPGGALNLQALDLISTALRSLTFAVPQGSTAVGAFDVAQALRDFQDKQAGKQDQTNGLLTETNNLLSESNTVNRNSGEAIRGLSAGLRSGSFATDQLKQQRDAQFLSGATR